MKKIKLEFLQTISRIAFVGFILLFVGAMFVKPPMQLFVFLFFTALLSELLYQLLLGIRDAKKIKSKKHSFKKLPAGSYKITDNKTKTNVGELSNEAVDFLREKFLKQGMDDNDFYFLSEILDGFIKEEKPNNELIEFLNNAIKNKTEVELHWEPIKII